MRRRTLVIALALPAFLAGLVWQMPLALPLGMALAQTGGRLGLVAAEGTWRRGKASLACRTAGGKSLACGHFALRSGVSLAGFELAAQGLRGTAVWRGAREWTGQVDALALPAGSLAALLPLVEQMQVGGELVVDGQLAGSGRALRRIALDVHWRGSVYEFAFAPQSLRIEGSGERVDMRWQPTDGLPRFEGAVSCDRAARCQGRVWVLTDGRDAALKDFLSAAGRRNADGTRFEFVLDVR